MPHIHVLSPHVANQIAAGEVIERPSSIVKELVENSIDAGADSITIEIENGGIDLIRIIDNGCGISDEDVEIAFLRHATSKIGGIDDISGIETLGFRGEALASIAAVSSVRLLTRTQEEDVGTCIEIEGGEIRAHSRIGCTFGTTIEVRNLFYNVPARLKFLKSPRAETGNIGDYVTRLILSKPQISFHFISNGKTVYRTNGDGNLKNSLISVYGITIAHQVFPVEYDDGYIKISGYVGIPELSRSNRTGQYLFLNGRIIQSPQISSALSRSMESRVMIGRYPFAVLSIYLSPFEVDVNIHPTKLQVHFADEERVTRTVYIACKDAIAKSYIPSVSLAADSTAPSPVAEKSTLYSSAHSPLAGQTISSSYKNNRSDVALEQSVPYSGHFSDSSSGSVKDDREPITIPVFKISKNERIDLFSNHSVELIQGNHPLRGRYTIIGSVFHTYWFIQFEDSVYIVDQHAAHERLLYDALRAKKVVPVSQALLAPIRMSLDLSDVDLFGDRKKQLEEYGFVFGNCDETSITILAVPVINGIPLREQFLLDIIHDHDFNKDSLMQKSCKHAVKGGDVLSETEIEYLLEQLLEKDTLLSCPHGRPIFVRITQKELEKMFKRIPE